MLVSFNHAKLSNVQKFTFKGNKNENGVLIINLYWDIMLGKVTLL